MKHLLLTTIAAVALVGCGPSMSIYEAAEAGNIETVKQHLDAGADANTTTIDGWTPLHVAKAKEIADLLIAKGPNLNAEANGGSTPMHSAAYFGQKEIVELLIAEGVVVNATAADGDTPLDRVDDKETTNLLRKHGGKTGEELKAEGK